MITWNGDCTGWIKWLEWGNNLEIVRIDVEWKHESSKISSALQNNWIARGGWLRDTPAYENTWNEEGNMINTESLNWIHRRRKGTKIDELEAPLESFWEPPDKNINGKDWRDFPSIKWYLIKNYESLKKKGGRAGKTKAAWGRWNKHRWENL